MDSLNNDEKRYLDAKKAYYNTGIPIMDDVEFDALEQKLKHQKSKIVNSVGYSLEDSKDKIEHYSPMLSLSKISAIGNNIPPSSQAIKWFDKINQTIIETSPKYDGNSATVIYNSSGNFDIALSRGDGIKGQDISSKLIEIIPNKISVKEGEYQMYEIRGEVLIGQKLFQKKYSKEFKNPRNFVSGVLNSLLPDINTLKDLTFIPYEIRLYNNNKYEYSDNLIETLKGFGFIYLPVIININTTASSFNKMFNLWKEYREKKSPFQLDGFVMKVIKNVDRQKLGENNHDPEWAKAVKFTPKYTITKIKAIEWSMGKTGELIPISILEPTDLDGSIVRRASMYNYGWVNENKCYPGCDVAIAKKGDIIPAIIKVINVSDTNNYLFPQKCDYCGDILVVEDMHLFCKNPICSGKTFFRLLYGINSLNLDGFGEATIKQIYENMDIKTPFELFDENKFNLTTLIYVGNFPNGKKIQNLINEINKIKTIQMETTLLMLGIPGLGKRVSKELAKKILNKPYSDYGLEKKFFEMFNQGEPEFKKLSNGINILRKKGIKIVLKREQTGIEFEMTGSPSNTNFKTKKDFTNFAKKFGYTHSSLNKNTQLLITNDYKSTKSKMVKASKMGVKIITYLDFIKKMTNKQT